MSSSPTGANGADDLPRLVRLAADGDQHAWSVLVRRFERLVLRVARSTGLDEAEAHDAAQTTWLRLFENLSRVNDAAHLSGWLATTVHREAVRLRGRCVHWLRDEESWPADPPHRDTTLEDMIAAERDAAVRSLLARMPDRDRALMSLLAAEPPVSYVKIGAALGMPIGSIGPTRARCLRRLRAEAGTDPDLVELLS